MQTVSWPNGQNALLADGVIDGTQVGARQSWKISDNITKSVVWLQAGQGARANNQRMGREIRPPADSPLQRKICRSRRLREGCATTARC